MDGDKIKSIIQYQNIVMDFSLLKFIMKKKIKYH